MVHRLIIGMILASTLFGATEGPGLQKDFDTRIGEYLKVRKKAIEGIPALKPKATPEQIQARKAAVLQAIREAREKGDTATANKLMAEQRAKMEERRNTQIAAIRGILTQDQLAQFDTNVAALKKRESEMGGMGMGRGRRGGPPGK